MDEKVANWIIEFLLRQSIDDTIINGVLSSLPFSKNDNRLKKMILLRKIESEISDGSISENLLEFLEIIEELDHREGKEASNLMKEAYCKIAVDCTVRFLDENVEENGKYFDAVERIWRNRVCLVDDLATEESNRCLVEIEAAIWDSGVCEKILMMNTRKEALKAVKSWLREGWESVGPSFLESVAIKIGTEVEEFRRGGGGGGGAVVCSENPCCELVASQGTQNGPAFVRRKHVATKSRRLKGAKISDAGKEDAESSMNKANDFPTHIRDNIQETVHSDSMQQCVATNDIHLGASQAAPDLSSPTTSNVNTIEKRTGPEIHATAEVKRVQYELRSSSRELHAAVTDPLPEAFKLAETFSSTRTTENCDTAVGNQRESKMQTIDKVDSVKVHAAVGNSSLDVVQEVDNVSSKTATISVDNDPALENQTQPKGDVPRESTDKNIESVEKGAELQATAQGNVIQDPKEQQIHKHRFMDANGTGHTLEWDDSIDNSSRGLPDGPRLPPSPNRSTVSPVMPYDDIKFRRKGRRWTAHEEATLRDAVQNLGHRWAVIRTRYAEVFKGRTDVDLKDKWRNMVRKQQ